MSYQKSKWKFPRPSLAKGARGCNQPATEMRAERLARKAARRAAMHAEMQDEARIGALLAGTHWTRERTLGGFGGAPICVLPARKVDSHRYLPHESEKRGGHAI